MKIIFIIEDDYLRYEIQGRLKAKGMFADNSFNSEIVKIEYNSLISVINEMYDDKTAQRFREEFKLLSQSKENKNLEKYKDTMQKFVVDTAKAIFTGAVVAIIKSRIGI